MQHLRAAALARRNAAGFVGRAPKRSHLEVMVDAIDAAEEEMARTARRRIWLRDFIKRTKATVKVAVSIRREK